MFTLPPSALPMAGTKESTLRLTTYVAISNYMCGSSTVHVETDTEKPGCQVHAFVLF